MIKKIIAWMLIIATTAAITVGGTLAYLTDRDSEANVFTVGNVDITLKEDYDEPSQLRPGVDINKDVQIKNEGPNDAYEWYTYAVPQGLEAGLILAFDNTDKWTNEATAIGTKTVDGVTYNVYACKYNEKVAAGATTEIGLTSVTMNPAVDITPEGDAYLIVAGEPTDLNWNINETENPVIFINAYAIQTQDFATVQAAYAAFEGQWGSMAGAGSYVPEDMIRNAKEAYDSTLKSGEFILGTDFKTSDADKHFSGNREYAVKSGIDYTLNLNGHTINHDGTYQDGNNTGYTYLYTTAYNGKLTINGNGTINSANSEGYACIVYAQGPSEVVINGGNFNVDKGIAVWAGKNGKVTIYGGSFISTGSAGNEELIYSSGGVIDIYGGFFHNKEWEERPVNVADANRSTGFINIYGGTFVNFDPSTGGNDPDNIKVAEGYKVVSETQANGDVWYTVVKA